MDCKNDEIFSPVKNSDEENKQHSDSFSEFLKGPDAFRKISKSEGNVNENTLSIKSISSKESSKALQDKSAKNEANQAKISSSSSTLDEALLIRLESSCSLKKVEADNLQSGSTKNNDDFSDTSLAAMHDEQIEAQCKIERKHASNTNMSQLCSTKKSLQANAAIVSRATTSKEMKKTKQQTLFSQCDPSSEIQSMVEKMVSDAVESQVDNLQQLIWSHHHSVSKVLLETKETLENRHASEKETLCKIMEELAEENLQLRNAASGHE
ncbi:unnamed protein product [Larinioides sclopetarius]|uniref:Uncharacterized protein n=1 Tax=Larinioides sclopetarius TaxID=280406 RepID=A0AAV1Z5Z5_9ARAC